MSAPENTAAAMSPQRQQQILPWLWLANGLGPAAGNALRVLQAFSSPALLQMALQQQDLSSLFTPRQLTVLRQTHPSDFAALALECAKLGVGVVTFADGDYPSQLRELADLPPVLYYRGSLQAAAAPLTVGVVGARKPSVYGQQATQLIAGGLASAGVVLVSGLANGLDSEAHRACLAAGVPTVACIAFGHDKCYPAANRALKQCIERAGLTVSEYPPGTEVQKPYFLQRNRLIAGLSHGLCVAEARRASGTMNTVSCALGYNRDVFAVPGSIFSPLSEGTNRLLCEGATPVTCAEDILSHYHMSQPAAQKAPAPQQQVLLSEQAAAMHKVLNYTPQTLTQLCAASKLQPAQAMAALTELELSGMAQQQAGRRFIIKE